MTDPTDRRITTDEEQQVRPHRLKRWRAYEPCPGCGGSYQSFGPGRLSDDSTTEIRTHDGQDGCGTEIRTTPYFEAAPSEADTFDLE